MASRSSPCPEMKQLGQAKVGEKTKAAFVHIAFRFCPCLNLPTTAPASRSDIGPDWLGSNFYPTKIMTCLEILVFVTKNWHANVYIETQKGGKYW